MFRLQLDLDILNAISRRMAGTLELDEVFNDVMAILADRLGMKRGTLVLSDGSILRIAAAHGLTKDEIERGRYAQGEGVTGRVVGAGMPIVVPDIRTDPLFLNRTGARGSEEQPISFICVPLQFGNTTIGALSADKNFTDAETLEADKRLLMIVATFIAQAVKINEMARREREKLMLENAALRRELGEKYQFENIVGISPAIRRVFDTIAVVAPSRATVLLQGETGTGKELVARAIHYSSTRRDKPCISVSCAALAESLLESELFGHVKGAFTGAIENKKGRFEIAHGGTLFLDEIGDMSEAVQVKLLRVLQERRFEQVGGTRTVEVDVRIIAATNRDLEKAVKEGRFREDLFYRLNVVPINIPPLRERREDIPLLAMHFIEKYNAENDKHVTGIAPDAMEVLARYSWPGNVRELESCIEMAVVMGIGDRLTADLLPPRLRPSTNSGEPLSIDAAIQQVIKMLDWNESSHGQIYDKVVPLLEKALIERAMMETDGVKLRAAQLLGINRNTLHKKTR